MRGWKGIRIVRGIIPADVTISGVRRQVEYYLCVLIQQLPVGLLYRVFKGMTGTQFFPLPGDELGNQVPQRIGAIRSSGI
jgi:hypothetical protein